MAKIKDHIKSLAEAMYAHHQAMSECHTEAANSSDGFQKTFHSSAAEIHTASAEKCSKVCDACSKVDETEELEKALLAKLAKSVVPDRVRAVGTDNPNRLIARQGDPQPETSDAEIPAEFVDVFQV